MHIRGSVLARAGLVLVVILGAALIVSGVRSLQAGTSVATATAVASDSVRAAGMLQTSSVTLTSAVREYTVTRDPRYLAGYWQEIDVTQSQLKALARLKALDLPQDVMDLADAAHEHSMQLVSTETRAMRLVLETSGAPRSTYPAQVAALELSAADRALSAAAKMNRARQLVFGAAYDTQAATVMGPLQQLTDRLASLAEKGIHNGVATQRRWARTGLVLSFVVDVAGLAILVIFLRQLSDVVASYSRLLDRSDPKDLTVRLTPRGVVETQQLARAVNARTASVTSVIDSVNQEAERLMGASTSLAAVSTQLVSSARSTTRDSATASAAAEDLSANIQTVATGTEQMGLSIQEIADAAGRAAVVAGEAVDAAGGAGRTVAKLGESSTLIGQVVQAINSIAEQTNLLALNATIEAARAGEAGKGFAVVATEVKELAEQTARSTRDISDQVAAIQTDSQAASLVLSEISEVIGRINDTQTTIASAVEQQTATTKNMASTVHEAAGGAVDITRNIQEVARSSQQTSASADQTQVSAATLATSSEDLRQLVAGFKV